MNSKPENKYRQLLEPLRKWAEKIGAGYEVEDLCWAPDDGNSYETYCEDCAYKQLDKVLAAMPENDPDRQRTEAVGILNCGADELDSFQYCATCEKPLDYKLTLAGIEDELDHYCDPETTIDMADPADAFHILRILESAEYLHSNEQQVYERLLTSGKFPMLVGPWDDKDEPATPEKEDTQMFNWLRRMTVTDRPRDFFDHDASVVDNLAEEITDVAVEFLDGKYGSPEMGVNGSVPTIAMRNASRRCASEMVAYYRSAHTAPGRLCGRNRPATPEKGE